LKHQEVRTLRLRGHADYLRNLYLNMVHFFNNTYIFYLKKYIFQHWCLIWTVLYKNFHCKFQIVLLSTGDIYFIPPATHRTFCAIDSSNWPWGEQNCSLVFGSWTYSENAINLLPYDEPSMGGAIDYKHFINPRVTQSFHFL